MLVSIIIPIYNVANYIERCLISVFEQTYQNIEIILVDDCSPDNSIALAEDIINRKSVQNSTIIVRHSINKGLSAARNSGINAAHGDYLLFVDSDDSLPHNAVENLVKYALVYLPDFVFGKFLKITDCDQIELELDFDRSFFNSNQVILDSFFSRKWYVMAWNKLVKRLFVLENNLFFKDGIYHEDNLWSFLLASKALSMAICPDITYNYYCNNSGSITSSIRPKNIKDSVFVLNEIISISIQQRYIEKDLCLRYLEDYRFYVLLDALSIGYKQWTIYYLDIVNNQLDKHILYDNLTLGYRFKRLLDIFPIRVVYCSYVLIRLLVKSKTGISKYKNLLSKRLF